MDKLYVGLASTFHDPALAIVAADGTPLFAEATERYYQDKRAYQLPPDAFLPRRDLISKLISQANEIVIAVNWSQAYLQSLDQKLQAMPSGNRSLQDYASWPIPGENALIMALRNSISQAGIGTASKRTMSQQVHLRYYCHHDTHAMLAAMGSGMESGAVAILDGFGENCAASYYTLAGNKLVAIALETPIQSGSLGEFYSLLCSTCGFDVTAGEEWKVMGLSSYGSWDLEVASRLRSLYILDGLSILRSPQFPVTVQWLHRHSRRPDTNPLQYANFAFTGQRVFEEYIYQVLDALQSHTGHKNLAYAGGCALNSTCNGKITSNTGFSNVYIPPAPGDDGTALGAAWLAWVDDQDGMLTPDRRMLSPFLGHEPDEAILDRIESYSSLPCQRFSNLDGVITAMAGYLAESRIVAWMCGKAEYGPRALGHRSILADPRSAALRDRINERVKFRELFRPFAPAVLDEYGPEYFENYQFSPYMERTLQFRHEVRDRVAGVVHVDGTGRLQSLREEWHPELYHLTKAFHAKTGIPLLLNTSLNIMGKPIVHDPSHAISVFLGSDIDVLVIDTLLLCKPFSSVSSPSM